MKAVRYRIYLASNRYWGRNEISSCISFDFCRGRSNATSKTSRASVVSIADIKADASLSAADRAELTLATAYATIYSKHFSWFTTGGGYTVTHNGTFYYNGSKAWATSSHAGYQGSHHCFVNYAVVVAISTQDCYEVGNDYERDFYFQWQVTWPWGPPYFGLSYTVSHWGSVYANGTTS
ncbi:hypothetical protein HNP00_001538 [Arthrobacter sp. AZCC_0090]|nr:hypothetical protein [Arthrobacter sp. AZCC_0090]